MSERRAGMRSGREKDSTSYTHTHTHARTDEAGNSRGRQILRACSPPQLEERERAEGDMGARGWRGREGGGGQENYKT